MKNRLAIVIRTVATCVALLGCTSTVDAELDDSGIAHRGVVSDDGGRRLEGVTICVHDRPDIGCALTDSGGGYELVIPEDSTALSYTADGFYPHLRMLAETTPDAFRMQTSHWLLKQVLRHGLGLEEPLVMLVATGDVVGLHLGLRPEALGSRLYYLNEEGDIDWSLDATSRDGRALIFRVPPGDYEATYDRWHPSVEPVADAMGEAGPPATVHVEAGYLTFVERDVSSR